MFRYNIVEESALRIVNYILFLFGSMVGSRHEMGVEGRSLNKAWVDKKLLKDLLA